MNLTLTRQENCDKGIFSVLKDEAGNIIAYTLEHAYDHEQPPGDERWEPKLSDGTYTCVRGRHQLHSGPIETFEITGVRGHNGVLFHCGNVEADSEGCVLLGEERVGYIVVKSKLAFAKFLDLQAGVDSFQLTVSS